jgi:AraC-like DNA-binding protein
MPYPVNFVTLEAKQLMLLGRQREPADQLLHLLEGSLLLRMGREEMVLRRGDSFWLPADCLHGLTLLQGCRLIRVSFSIRVSQSRPQSAGHLLLPALLPPLLARLDEMQQTQTLAWHGPAGRLLRVIAEREVTPLGAERCVPVNFALVCATHQDLQGMLRDKGFREDLFYRLNGMNLRLPPLRERSDRAQLIQYLLDSQADASGLHLTDQARQCLLDAPWPGNIRQLLNALRYAVALAEDGCIDVDCLPGELLHSSLPARSESPPASDEPQASGLLELLRRHRWNISAAASELGVARSTLYRQMKKQRLVQPNDRL